jgi:hypothetical protein
MRGRRFSVEQIVMVETPRLELPSELLSLGHQDLGPVHDPLPDAGNSLALALARGHSSDTPLDELGEK